MFHLPKLLFPLLIFKLITQIPTLDIRDITDRGIVHNSIHIHLIIQSHRLPSIRGLSHRRIPRNKKQPLSRVNLLPLPVETVKVIVMKVKYRVSRGAVHITHLSECLLVVVRQVMRSQTHNTDHGLMAPDMRVVRHASIKTLKVGSIELIAIAYIRSCAVSQASPLCKLTGRAVICCQFQRSDMLCSVCERSRDDAVVDVAAVSTEVLV